MSVSLLLFLSLFVAFSVSGEVGKPKPPECKNSVTAGSMTMKVDGKETTVNVMTGYPPRIHPSGGTVTVVNEGNAHLSATCNTQWGEGELLSWNLMGKTLSWVTDLSAAGCGCNASPFLSAAPGIGPDGKPVSGSGGEWMCDAPSDPACLEFDSFEANRYAAQTTAHVCAEVDKNGYSQNCTGPTNSCMQNTYKNLDGTALNKTAWGPGDQYVIDSTTSFWTGVTFIPDAGNSTLEQVHIVYAQGKRHKTLLVKLNGTFCEGVGGASYLQRLGDQMMTRGLTLTMSYWSSPTKNMAWLDSPPCDPTVKCDKTTKVTFGGFQIDSPPKGIRENPALVMDLFPEELFPEE